MNGCATRRRFRSSGITALEDGVGVLTVGAARRQPPELAEMHIDRQIGATADLGGHFDDANARRRTTDDLGVSLDTANDIGFRAFAAFTVRRC